MPSNAFRRFVGIAAIAAPALHSATDVLEWCSGFSNAQLWLNYAAFLPMPWLLLGVYVVHDRDPGAVGLAGAVLYGTAFTYFAHTTLYALTEGVPDYETLWRRLGITYTVHGAAMVAGGLLFSWSGWRARWLPRVGVGLFAAGVLVNFGLALVPAPDIFQTLGSAVRNTGLVVMGCGILKRSLNQSPQPPATPSPS